MLNLAATVLTAVDDGNAEGASQNFFQWLFGTSGFHPPSVKDFNPEALLFGGTILEFNRITFVRVVAAVVMIGIFWLGARRAKVVPGRGQAALELVLDFVRVQIAEEVMGAERARKYVPFLTTLFIAIVFFNITSVVPLLNIPGTSLIGLPIVMALWVYVMYLGAGVRKLGLGGFLKSSLFPPGVPWPIYLLLAPIEAIQVFVLRPATLALRLAAKAAAVADEEPNPNLPFSITIPCPRLRPAPPVVS